MILFEYICENQKIVSGLVRYGVLPVDIEFKIRVYRTYLEHRQSAKRVQAVENTAKQIGGSFRNVYGIIQKMEQEV